MCVSWTKSVGYPLRHGVTMKLITGRFKVQGSGISDEKLANVLSLAVSSVL